MPIVTKSATQTTPPVVIPESGYANVVYYDPSGTAWPLTNPKLGWFTIGEGVSGVGVSPYTLTSDPHPRGGARLRHVQAQPRSINWPLMITGDTHEQFITRWRALARAFASTLRGTPGTLEFQRPDGSRRQIDVYYEAGFDTSGDAYSGITWDSAVLSLWCEDPYWVNPAPQTMHREHGAGVDYFVPYPSVSSGQVLGATTVTNEGDVIVWPEWTITGPASLVTFTHAGTGASFTLDPASVGGALLAGETVTVRTDPVQVRYQSTTNWIGALNFPGADLWGLEPGDNEVTFQLDGSAAGSAVDLTYHPRYETA